MRHDQNARVDSSARNAVGDRDLSYVVIHDKEGNLAGAAGELVHDAGQIPDLVKSSRGSSMSGNPRDLTDEELLAILEDIY